MKKITQIKIAIVIIILLITAALAWIITDLFKILIIVVAGAVYWYIFLNYID